MAFPTTAHVEDMFEQIENDPEPVTVRSIDDPNVPEEVPLSWDDPFLNVGDGEREASFDLTDFGSAESFLMVLKEAAIQPLDYVRVEGMPNRDDPYFRYVWYNENGVIVTGNNPLTGQYSDPEARQREEGYASYIGVEGTEAFVERAVEAIQNHAAHIKDFDPDRRSFA